MKKLLNIIFIIFFFFVLSFSSVHALTVSLPASADSYVDSSYLNSPAAVPNFSTIWIKNYASSDHPGTFMESRGLIKFDLSGIPNNAVINSARLRIYAYTTYLNRVNSVKVSIWRNTGDWSESLVTWNNQPPAVDLGISSPVTFNANGYTPWDVTDTVKGWKNGSYSNYGFKIIGQRLVNQYNIEYKSKDFPDQDLSPKISVDYSLPVNLVINPNLFRGLNPTATPTLTPTPTPTPTPTSAPASGQQPTITSASSIPTATPTLPYYGKNQVNNKITPTLIPEEQASAELTPIPPTPTPKISLFSGIKISRLAIAIIMVCVIIILLVLGFYALSKWDTKSRKVIEEKAPGK